MTRLTAEQVKALMDDLCDWSDLPRILCQHCIHPDADLPDADEQVAPKPASVGPWQPVTAPEDGRQFARPAAVTMPGWGQPCQGCSALAGDAYLCPACIDQLEVWLADLPMLDQQLEVTLTRQDKVRRPTPRVKAPEAAPRLDSTDPAEAARALGKRAPGRKSASTARDQVRAELTSAILALTKARGLVVPQLVTVQDMADWLGRASASVALDPAGADIVAGIGRAWQSAVRVIDTAPERRWVGACPSCAGRVMAAVGAEKARCRVCLVRLDVADLLAARDGSIRANVGTVTACVDMAQVCGYRPSKATVKSWVQRGQLVAYGVNELGTAVYRMGDVLDLLRRRGAGSNHAERIR